MLLILATIGDGEACGELALMDRESVQGDDGPSLEFLDERLAKLSNKSRQGLE